MKKIITLIITIVLFFGCVTDPLTGKSTMAFVPNSQLFPMAFTEYQTFLNENKVIVGTPDAQVITRVGKRLTEAAEKWYVSVGEPNYLKDYRWEYNLVEDNTINAWCMPGGKIVFYTGILPITQGEAGVAVVMGHEICHALLNHGQQRVSAGMLQEGGMVAASVLMQILGVSPEVQALGMLGYQAGTTLAGTLPFSRNNESEADRFGLTLMAIAGYNPEEAAPFWERMSALSGSGGTPQFLSTHPSDSTRIRQLRGWVPEAKQKAAELGVVY